MDEDIRKKLEVVEKKLDWLVRYLLLLPIVAFVMYMTNLLDTMGLTQPGKLFLLFLSVIPLAWALSCLKKTYKKLEKSENPTNRN